MSRFPIKQVDKHSLKLVFFLMLNFILLCSQSHCHRALICFKFGALNFLLPGLRGRAGSE